MSEPYDSTQDTKDHIAAVQYIAKRGMWRVTVFHNGVFRNEAYFHTKWGANQWAKEVEARG